MKDSFNRLNSGLISDCKLWLGQDMTAMLARVTLYQCGPDQFELYVQHGNSAVPIRYVGKLGLMVNVGERFIEARKAEGYVEQLPSYNPHAWIA